MEHGDRQLPPELGSSQPAPPDHRFAPSANSATFLKSRPLAGDPEWQEFYHKGIVSSKINNSSGEACSLGRTGGLSRGGWNQYICIRYANLLSAEILEWPTILSSWLITESHDTTWKEHYSESIGCVCICLCTGSNELWKILSIARVSFLLFVLFWEHEFLYSKAILKLSILLPLPPKCWGYRCMTTIYLICCLSRLRK